jgi:hypothetical protein
LIENFRIKVGREEIFKPIDGMGNDNFLDKNIDAAVTTANSVTFKIKINTNNVSSHVTWVSCHDDMESYQVSDAMNGLQIWWVSANVLTADKERSSGLHVGLGARTSSMEENPFVKRRYKCSQTWTDSFGKGPNLRPVVLRDRLCGLEVRVPGYRTEMYCGSSIFMGVATWEHCAFYCKIF